MKRFFYIDAEHADGLFIYACDKGAARVAVCKEYGYAALPRRHCLASVSP